MGRIAGGSRRAAPLFAASALLSFALAGASVSPSWAGPNDRADDGPRAAAAALVEEFELGGGAVARIDERSGAFSVELAVGRLGLRWDSAADDTDRYGLGARWTWAGLGYVGVLGGIRAVTPTGRTHDADETAATGLRGYDLADVHFAQEERVVTARDDALAPARSARFALAELGGEETVFGDHGDPVLHRDAFDNRVDWVWDEVVPHRLNRSVDPVGVVSTVDWSAPGALVVTTASGEREIDAQVFTIEQSGGRIDAVQDPTTGRTVFGYSDDGLLERVTTATGAVTEVAWRTHADGTSGAERVRISDGATGGVLADRGWRAVHGSASGWPDARDFTTAITDGTTEVRSTYTPTGLLVERALSVTSASGTSVIELHRLGYPGMEGGVHLDPDDLPARFTRPNSSTRTWYTATGAERSATELLEHDEFGRLTRHTAVDGTVTETEYDSTVAGDRPLPVGLPTRERVIAPDGLIEQTEYTLNADRTGVVAEELARSARSEGAGTGDASALVPTARTEFTVQADGFVRTEAVFPQGGAGTPVVTDRTRLIDHDAGTETIAETRAAGTPIAVTTTRVTSLVHGEPVAETDAAGGTTTFDRDAAGRETARVDPAGIRVTTIHRSAELDGTNAVTTVRADRVETTEHFDAIGRLVRTTDNLSSGHPLDGHTRLIESRDYPDPATETVTDAWGATTMTRRDVHGRVVETIGPTGLHDITAYDDAANTRTTGTSPTSDLGDAPMTVTERLDPRGEVTQTTGARADGRAALTTEHGRDGFGRERTVDDGISTTTVERDAHGNPVSTRIAASPGGAEPRIGDVIVTRAFDPTGTTTEQTLSRGGESRSGGVRVVDELGRTTSETDQTGRTTVMDYTPDGLLERRTTGYGQVTEHRYDDATRRLVETVVSSPAGAAVHTRSEYDPVLGTVTAVFDPTDRAGTEIAYDYDAHGNPTRIAYPDGSVIAHRYDEHGRRIATTDVAGATTTYAYDGAGRLTAVVQRDSAGNELARTTTSFDRLGRVADLTHENGVVSRFEYTSAGEIASEQTTDASGNTVSSREYEYDARGNLLARSDRVRPPGAADEPGTLFATQTAYTYDVHDRLTSSTFARLDDDADEASVIARAVYETTVSGDLRSERIERSPGSADATTLERHFSYAPTGELVRVATATATGLTVTEQTHDEAGNLVVDVDGTRYAYNAANRQVAETTAEGVTIATRYWADGQRAELASAERAGAATTRFYWDGGTLLNDVHEAGDQGVRAASYLLGAARHARTVLGPGAGQAPGADAGAGAGASRTEYVVHDRHGSVSALTAADGAVTERYTYADYGDALVWRQHDGRAPEAAAPFRWQVGDAETNPFGYAGEYTDPTGTQHLQTRSYHSGIRQFTTADTEPLHNRYAYADLNPITNVDPTGRSSQSDGIDWASLMQEPWFKILSTVLAVVLTVVSFFSMNTPGVGATTALIVGYWGGMASGSVQAVGASMLAVDTVNAFVEEPFWEKTYAGQVQFAGSVLSSVGAIAGGAFRIARKIGVDAMKVQLVAANGKITDLTAQNSTLAARNTLLANQNMALESEKAALMAELKRVDPHNRLLQPAPPVVNQAPSRLMHVDAGAPNLPSGSSSLEVPINVHLGNLGAYG